MSGNTHPNIVISEELNLRFTDVFKGNSLPLFVCVAGVRTEVSSHLSRTSYNVLELANS